MQEQSYGAVSEERCVQIPTDRESGRRQNSVRLAYQESFAERCQLFKELLSCDE